MFLRKMLTGAAANADDFFKGENFKAAEQAEPSKNIMDFKLTPKAIRKTQNQNFKIVFPGYEIEYIFGPGPWRNT